MLQGFYWGSYDESSWAKLGAADTVALYSKYFDVIWVPQSGSMPYEGSRTMGYMPYYFFKHNSCFGTEAELRSMISAYKAKGTTIMEDVVVNHHSGVNQTDMLTFPTETWTRRSGDTQTYTYLKENTPYKLETTDILKNDDGGSSQAYLDELNARSTSSLSLSKNDEETYKIDGHKKVLTTEDFNGARDLDHRSANVNTIVKAYEEFLTKDLGYGGFRYDMARGFLPKHLVDYNKATKPRFSVGEIFDGNFYVVKWWINHWTDTTIVDNQQKVTHYSAAFDFPLHFSVMTEGFKLSDFTQRRNAFTLDPTGEKSSTPLFSDRSLSRYDVTFVDNHDTYYPRYDRSQKDASQMVDANILAANAYILGMPGTPCVYFKHWLDPTLRPGIEKLIMARKAAGIHNQSRITRNGYDPDDADGYYAEVQGDNGSVLMFFGKIDDKTLTGEAANTDKWQKVLSGDNFEFYISARTAYSNYQKYTSDTQTGNPYVDDKAKDDDESNVSTDAQSTTGTIDIGYRHIFVNTADNPVYVYACQGTNWDKLTGEFPGKKITANNPRQIEGKDGSVRYYYEMEVPATDFLNIIISNGDVDDEDNGTNQTVDIKNLTGDNLYFIYANGDESTGKKGKIATYKDVTEAVTGIAQRDTIYGGYTSGKHTIYFKNTIGWYKPTVRVTGDDGGNWTPEFAASADGVYAPMDTVKMNNDEYFVWKYTGDETAEPKHVIFTPTGGTPQTVNLDFKDNNVYTLSLTRKATDGNYNLERAVPADEWNKTSAGAKAFFTTTLNGNEASSQAKPRREEKSATYTHSLYFINSVSWNDVYIYGWGNDFPAGNPWPGKPMSLRPEKQGNYNIYSYTWTSTSPNMPEGIIFNSGGKGYDTGTKGAGHGRQTEDIKANITDGNAYEIESTEEENGDGNLLYKVKDDSPKKYTKPFTVYFKNTPNYTRPAIYWWDPKDEAVSWDQCPQLVKVKVNGYDLWAYTWDTTKYKTPDQMPKEFLFRDMASHANDDGQAKDYKYQTVNLTFNDEYVYTPGALILQDGNTDWGKNGAGTSVAISQYREKSAEKTYTIYFRNKQNWKKVYVYTYPELDGSWPGREITGNIDTGNDGIPLYKYTYTTTDPNFTLPTIVVFNNGNGGEGNQSADLTFKDKQVYVLGGTGKYTLAKESAQYGSYKEDFKFTVYFDNTVGWNEPHIWVWGPGGNFTKNSWPDKPAMTKTTLNGKEVWMYKYDNSSNAFDYIDGGKTVHPNGLPTQIIFAAADKPVSVDLNFVDNAIYELSPTDKDKKDADGKVTDEPGSKHELKSAAKPSDEMLFLNRLYSRLVRPGTINTICLPFGLTAQELISMKLKAYDLTHADGMGTTGSANNVDDGMLTFTRVRNMDAYHPYIVIYSGANATNVFNSRVIAQKEDWTIDKTKSLSNTVGDWTFTGTLEPIEALQSEYKAGGKVYFGYSESLLQFVQMRNGKAKVPASVCYFTLPYEKVKTAGVKFDTGTGSTSDTDDAHKTDEKTSGAKHFTISLDDDDATADIYVYGDDATATGIGTVSTNVNDDAPVYNLAGQRVGKDYKGVVIQNGRKIIRR